MFLNKKEIAFGDNYFSTDKVNGRDRKEWIQELKEQRKAAAQRKLELFKQGFPRDYLLQREILMNREITDSLYVYITGSQEKKDTEKLIKKLDIVLKGKNIKLSADKYLAMAKEMMLLEYTLVKTRMDLRTLTNYIKNYRILPARVKDLGKIDAYQNIILDENDIAQAKKNETSIWIDNEQERVFNGQVNIDNYAGILKWDIDETTYVSMNVPDSSHDVRDYVNQKFIDDSLRYSWNDDSRRVLVALGSSLMYRAFINTKESRFRKVEEENINGTIKYDISGKQEIRALRLSSCVISEYAKGNNFLVTMESNGDDSYVRVTESLAFQKFLDLNLSSRVGLNVVYRGSKPFIDINDGDFRAYPKDIFNEEKGTMPKNGYKTEGMLNYDNKFYFSRQVKENGNYFTGEFDDLARIAHAFSRINNTKYADVFRELLILYFKRNRDYKYFKKDSNWREEMLNAWNGNTEEARTMEYYGQLYGDLEEFIGFRIDNPPE